jgi:hypothetical protein
MNLTEQSLDNLQKEIYGVGANTPLLSNPGAINPDSKLAQGLDSIVRVGTGQQSLGGALSTFSGGQEKYRELKNNFAEDEEVWKDMIRGDVGNLLNLKGEMKDVLLSGGSIPTNLKDYMAGKINESDDIPFNISKDGDKYKFSKAVPLGPNAYVDFSKRMGGLASMGYRRRGEHGGWGATLNSDGSLQADFQYNLK